VWDLVRDFIKDVLGKLPRVVTAAILASCVAIFAVYKFYDFKDATFRQVIEQRWFWIAALIALAVIWIIAAIIGAIAHLRRPRLPREALQVAVANFFGNSELANDEARGLRTLIRQELNRVPRAQQAGPKT